MVTNFEDIEVLVSKLSVYQIFIQIYNSITFYFYYSSSN